MITDIAAQVTAWALDEAAKLCFGEDYGIAVTWGPQQISGPQGAGVVSAWFLLVTARNPLLGQPRLCHIAPLGVPEPDEAAVREQAGAGIRQLRELAAKNLSTMNGHGHDPAAAH